jgi:serine/threonine protein kinase
MLDDKYRIERLLATGGMGAVYLGTHVGLRKRVAIKVLNPELSSAPMLERFHREAITASQIGHEGIAQVTDLGMSDLGEPFLVMEYLEGESLASRLKASGPLPIEDACELGCAILSPLAAAHFAGIVHRDLKPDNVFLVRQSRGEMVKLLDFGISRTVDRDATFRLTTTGLVLGTPYYMSPEQARGDSEVTTAADLYAFGVILYEMLIGDVPIRAENYNQLMYRVMMGDFVWPRQRRPDLPEVLEQLIVRAMAQDPRNRQASAGEIEQALLPFCRQVFRDHVSGRLSAPGLPFKSASGRPGVISHGAHGTGTGSGSGNAMVAATVPDRAVPGHSGVRNLGTHPNLPPGAYATMPDPPRGAVSATGANPAPAPRKSRAWIAVVALLVVAGGVGIAIAVGGGGGPSAPAPTQTATQQASGPPTTPGPTTTTPPPAQPTTTTPPPAQPTTTTPPPPPQTTTTPSGGATAHPDEPPTPTTITLRLAIDPSSATIAIDGRKVTGPEISVPRDTRTHQMKITAPGYVAHEDTISFDESQRLVVQLKRAAGRGKTTPRDPDGIDSQSPYH